LRSHDTLADFIETENSPTSYWVHFPRFMYNRASDDPAGNPWPKEARLARRFGNSAKGYIYWDADAVDPDPAHDRRTIEGRWTGLDVPDFPINKPPTAKADRRRPGARLPPRRLAVHHEGRRQGLAYCPLRPG
jgi:hypothetical protein